MECKTCKKPASLFCGGCTACPALDGDAPLVSYCGVACQKGNNDLLYGCIMMLIRLLNRRLGVAQVYLLMFEGSPAALPCCVDGSKAVVYCEFNVTFNICDDVSA